MFFGFMERFFINKRRAYSLAEMLIVLFIISIILLSLPKATKKFFEVKEVKTYHGRYECYWSRDGNGEPQLRSFYYKERVGQEPLVEDKAVSGVSCEFTPPLTYPYLMIHAVGGGGAGGNITSIADEPILSTSYVDYSPTNESSWPKWFSTFVDKVIGERDLKAQFHIKDGSSDEKNDYSTNYTVRQLNLKYRKSGNAGAVSSMFFPFLPSGKTFRLYPGKGGELAGEEENGKDGENTIVQVLSPGESCEKNDLNSACNIIVARGGTGAIVLGTDGDVIDMSKNVQLLGGAKSDFDISKNKDVVEKESGFKDIISSIKQYEARASNISADAGNGGNGANHYVKGSTAGFFFHEFDNYSGKEGDSEGVNWVPISQYVNLNAYGTSCGYAPTPDGFSVKRSSVGDISTQCIPDSNTYGTSYPYYYYCTVGYMNRNATLRPEIASMYSPNSSCEGGALCANANKGPCACYVFKHTSNNNYTKQGGPYYNHIRYSGRYTNPVFKDGKFSVDEIIPENTPHISCQAQNGYEYNQTPCGSGGEFDPAKGICKAKRGGDGAIVILW